MPDYGEAPYWDERYKKDVEPFDWLFDLQELLPIIEYLIPDKNEPILVVGAGNANFSPDLQRIGGYTNIVNIDISPIVIEQQKQKYPEQKWLVMDITDMSDFPDHSFPYILDKSLIDTLLCANNSIFKIMQMLDEMYRVLKPGGRILTFSLHNIEKNTKIYQNEKFNSLWRSFFYNIRSNRWNENENSRKSVAHTMIICDKPRNFLRNYEVYSELKLNLTQIHNELVEYNEDLIDNISSDNITTDDNDTIDHDIIEYIKLKYNNIKNNKELKLLYLKDNNLIPYYCLPYKNIYNLPGVLTPLEYDKLKKYADDVNFRYNVLDSSTKKLARALFKATQKLSEEKSEIKNDI